MQLINVETDAQRKKYLRFINELYAGDRRYVCTAKFNAHTLIYRQTSFAQTCFIQSIILQDGSRIRAVCTYFHTSAIPYLQIGLFEAEEGANEAIKLIINEARKIAMSRGLTKIVVGLNGHLSYGVGILEKGFEDKVSFDSIYNKSYYENYFASYSLGKETLSTYRASAEDLRKKLQNLKPRRDFKVRTANLKQFDDEMEIMQRLCDETLGKTFLYGHTDKGHFSQLISGLKLFLRDENLLFVLSGGREIGFLFWHPDYNNMINAGKEYNLLQIFFAAKKARKQADTVKLNAIGVIGNNPFATVSLISAFEKFTTDNFKFVETNFVWDNNLNSFLINKHLFGEPSRKYGVYFIDV